LISLNINACISNQKNENFEIIKCIHKYDKSRIVEYESQNITRFIINDIITFYIIDINGKEVFLNIYEIENYKCIRNEKYHDMVE
jgi:hypothetical protein